MTRARIQLKFQTPHSFPFSALTPCVLRVAGATIKIGDKDRSKVGDQQEGERYKEAGGSVERLVQSVNMESRGSEGSKVWMGRVD